VAEAKDPLVAVKAVEVVAYEYNERVPPVSMVAVCAVPVLVSLDKRRVDLAADSVTAPVVIVTAAALPVVFSAVAT
jgi:hypothetical protein